MAHCSTLLESLLLEQGEMLKQGFQPVSVQLSSMGEVTRRGQHLLVDGKDLIQCPLIDVQCWERCTEDLAQPLSCWQELGSLRLTVRCW